MGDYFLCFFLVIFEVILHDNLQILINKHIVKDQHGPFPADFFQYGDRLSISNLCVFTNSASLAMGNKQKIRCRIIYRC